MDEYFGKQSVNGEEVEFKSHKELLKEVRSETIHLGDKLAVFEDKKTRVKTVALPFTFPDSTEGALTITHISKVPWKPSDDIESITINYKTNEN